MLETTCLVCPLRLSSSSVQQKTAEVFLDEHAQNWQVCSELNSPVA